MSFSFPVSLSIPFSRSNQMSEAAAAAAQQAPAVSPPPPPPPPEVDAGERRLNQRFVAQRQGEACFWALVGNHRVALNDLSITGFSLPLLPDYPLGTQFDFTLQRDGIPDAVRGRAQIVNQLGKDASAKLGCRIIQFNGDDAERLKEWLVTHVICSATVRITEKDAAAIVAGRPLI
ncbi:hypothetical protein AGMMS50225_19920 [Betaproteobacteria bacterium]|nr:hypothetical protein AGMMS50225_19920 [Betaproteobacteria bacterium]